MKVKTLATGEKLIIADAKIRRALDELADVMDNKVEAGCWVDTINYGASAAIAAISVSTGFIRQAGNLRLVNGIASMAAPASGAQLRGIVYVPSGGAKTAATPTVLVCASSANKATGFPVLPEGAILLAQLQGDNHASYAWPANINNNAQPNRFSDTAVPGQSLLDWSYFD